MNAVVYYSNTGQSRAVAVYLAERLDYPLVDLEACTECHFDNLVLVFPVYCQNIPDTVKGFLSGITADHLTPVATYGKMCYGNVLHEIQKKYPCTTVVAGAYVPTKHTYLTKDTPFSDYSLLEPLVDKVKHPAPIRLPRTYKNPFANLLPALRSYLGVDVYRTEACDGCGLCSVRCPQCAIQNGHTGTKCIRCLRCVSECPRGALAFKLRFPLSLYLRKRKVTRTVVYV